MLGVPIHSGGLKTGDLSRAPWKVILAELRLFQIIRELKPVVVHSFLPLVTFMGALAGRVLRVPLVITSRRALGTHQERHAVLRPLDRLANRLSHFVTVNSRAVWDDVVSRDHVDPNKLVLIYNGIDARPFELASEAREELRNHRGLRDSDKVIVVVGNLIPYKGHRDFIRAASHVKKRIPEATFWLVGEDRGIQKDLERRAQDLGIHDCLVFMGRRTDIPNILAASDLLVLPSDEEGFSNVILEGMAAGLPVVATRVGGNPEAIVEGVTGWLVSPRSPKQLAAKIIDLLINPEKARSWGEQGRERIKEHFRVERMVENHLLLYQSVQLMN